jgi:hypothetical protein
MSETTTQEKPKLVDSSMIARVCHEANRAICLMFGDNSQFEWDKAKQWQLDSAVKGVEFRIANPGGTPEDQHNAWMADKEKDGWVYGPVKDMDAKTHPCMVTYNELPAKDRIKDKVFCAIVDAMIAFETEGAEASEEKKPAAKEKGAGKAK